MKNRNVRYHSGFDNSQECRHSRGGGGSRPTEQVRINREDFKKYMEEVIRLTGLEDRVSDVLQEFNNDFNRLFFSPYQTLISKILKDAMDDGFGWIDYWVYDLNYGKESKILVVKDGNGEIVPLKTIDDLYDLLIK